MPETVIVRDARGDFRRMCVLGAVKGLIYVAAPEALEAVEAGEIMAVGHPKERVFIDVYGGNGPIPSVGDLVRYRM